VGMIGRRLGGPWVGLLAALLLMLNGVQVWFSRYSTTETTAQFLTFAGLWAFAAIVRPEWRVGRCAAVARQSVAPEPVLAVPQHECLVRWHMLPGWRARATPLPCCQRYAGRPVGSSVFVGGLPQSLLA